jgi:hypothetical protein
MRFRKFRLVWLAVWIAFSISVYLRQHVQLGLNNRLGLRNVPDWLVVSLCVAIGFVPWLPWPRQFSLRTLLIATTLIAVALGIIVWLR